MLEAGCNPNYKMPDGSNWTVLMIAANAGHDELVQKFSKGGKGVSDKDSSGFQAMMLAALKGHTSVCRCLLDKKADPNANNEFGETPLMMAAAMGHKDVVSMLLDSGADANARDANEMSAVKKASRWGHVDCLRTARTVHKWHRSAILRWFADVSNKKTPKEWMFSSLSRTFTCFPFDECFLWHQIAPDCTRLHQIAPDCTGLHRIAAAGHSFPK